MITALKYRNNARKSPMDEMISRISWNMSVESSWRMDITFRSCTLKLQLLSRLEVYSTIPATQTFRFLILMALPSIMSHGQWRLASNSSIIICKSMIFPCSSLIILFARSAFSESLLQRQTLLNFFHHFYCRCIYCINDITFEKIKRNASFEFCGAMEKSHKLFSVCILTSFERYRSEILKQMKQNQELIIKYADNPCSPEMYKLKTINSGFFHILGHLVNFPCVLNEEMYPKTANFENWLYENVLHA